MDMRRRTRLAVLGGVMLVLPGLAACGSGSASAPGSGAAAAPGTAIRQITAKAVGGSPGKGPLVVPSPVPLPGGKAGSQKVALGDRTLVINSVTKHQGNNHDPRSVLIELNLVVRNTGKKAIRNESGFFELIGSGGDTFSHEARGSDAFYGTISTGGSRSGLIEFQVPASAASGLSLLYRPENATEAVITRLQVSLEPFVPLNAWPFSLNLSWSGDCR
jgi:hypothetical protein